MTVEESMKVNHANSDQNKSNKDWEKTNIESESKLRYQLQINLAMKLHQIKSYMKIEKQLITRDD